MSSMNSNFKLIRAHQYLNDYCNDLIREPNFQPNPKLFYASFLINSYAYDLKVLNTNITNTVTTDNSNLFNAVKNEESEPSKRENDWYNSEYPKLIGAKKRWSHTADTVDSN